MGALNTAGLVVVIKEVTYLFFRIIFNKSAWKIIMGRKLRMSPKKFYNPKININLIVENMDFGDWKLIYQVMRYD